MSDDDSVDSRMMRHARKAKRVLEIIVALCPSYKSVRDKASDFVAKKDSHLILL